MFDSDTEVLLQIIALEMSDAVQVIDQLHTMGYEANFELVGGLLRCSKNHRYYKIKDLQVDEIYRFHDDSGILNGTYIYAVREIWDCVKGIFVAYLPGEMSHSVFTTP